jgi:hypothetical protein
MRPPSNDWIKFKHTPFKRNFIFTYANDQIHRKRALRKLKTRARKIRR